MTVSSFHPGPNLGKDPPPEGRVVQIGPDRLLDAIARLLAVGGRTDRTHATRFLEFAAANQIRLDSLWAFENPRGILTAAVLAVPSPGKTAMLFATQPVTESHCRTAGLLLHHACGALPRLDVHLAQALLDTSDTMLKQAFVQAGFAHLANLTYLERPLGRNHPSEAALWPDGVTVEPYRPELDDEIIDVLNASYENTRDCPGLVGLRRTQDVLAGHCATGRFEPALWTLLRIDKQPAGVLMLNPSPSQKAVELVYLGLVVAARGRGLGRQLLRHGLSQLRGRAERNVTLAVDNANEPAMRLYLQEGFRRALQRVAMIRPMHVGKIR